MYDKMISVKDGTTQQPPKTPSCKQLEIIQKWICEIEEIMADHKSTNKKIVQKKVKNLKARNIKVMNHEAKPQK